MEATNTKYAPTQKAVYAVYTTNITMDGDFRSQTKWYSSIEEIPAVRMQAAEGMLTKTYLEYPQPTMADFKEACKTGNKFWLDTKESITETKIQQNAH